MKRPSAATSHWLAKLAQTEEWGKARRAGTLDPLLDLLYENGDDALSDRRWRALLAKCEGPKMATEAFFFHGTASRPGYGKLHPHSPSLSEKQAKNAGIDLSSRVRSPRSIATDSRPVGTKKAAGGGGDFKDQDWNDAIFQSHWEVFASKLTDKERQGLYAYSQNGGYNRINAGLRQGDLSTFVAGRSRTIDAAIDKGALHTDTLLYRGFDKKSNTDAISSLQPGQTFVDKGYSSTSLSKKAAEDWAVLGGAGLRTHRKPFVVVIEAKAGTKGAYISQKTDVTDMFGRKDRKTISSQGEGEREFVMARGAKFRVISNDGWQIRVEHLGYEPDELPATKRSKKASEPSMSDKFIWKDDDVEVLSVQATESRFFHGDMGGRR